MNYISLDEKFSHIRNLIEMAKSDGNLNMAELTYISWVAMKLGVSTTDLNRLFQEENKHVNSLSDKDRISRYHRIINMMYVDGKIDPNELNKCEELGVKMKLNKQKIEKLLGQISTNDNKMISLEELENLFLSW